ncbi:WhiB family transcriptional regulator [Nocardioides sp.]|uniref:WhiB family transcriptional regulator n=1 Tax=Nocardioides sp. TaxID=35761 RepID=UPI00356852E5
MTSPPCEADPDLFFDEGNAGRTARAKKVCAGCPLRDPCLTEALAHAVEGVWSATTTDERKAMRRRAGIKARQIVTNPLRWKGEVA